MEILVCCQGLLLHPRVALKVLNFDLSPHQSFKKLPTKREKNYRNSSFELEVKKEVLLSSVFPFFSFSFIVIAFRLSHLLFFFSRLNSFSINFNFIEVKEKSYKMDFSYQKRVSTFTRGVITRMSANDGH